MVETVDALDRATQRDVAGEKDVRPVQRNEQETVRRPRSDARHLGQGCLDLFVCHAFKRRIAQPPIDESLRERPQRRAFASREPGGTKHLRIGCQQLGRRRQTTAESLFDALIASVPPGSMGLTLQPYWSPGLRDPGPVGSKYSSGLPGHASHLQW